MIVGHCEQCGEGYCEHLAERARIALAREENPGRSNRFIAEAAGVSHSLVNETPETVGSALPTGSKIGRDGAIYTPRRKVEPPNYGDVPPGFFRPITNDEIRENYETADQDVKDWIEHWTQWKPRKRADAQSLLFNLITIGALKND